MSDSPDNRIQEPFLLLLTAAICVTAFSLPRTDFEIQEFKAKPFTFIADIQSSGLADSVEGIKPVLTGQEQKAKDIFFGGGREKGQIQEFFTPEAAANLLDSMGGLAHFFKALEELRAGRKKSVRIAWFGDSMIEGDLITKDFRKCFQDSFGGYGVGFMPVTSIVAGFRGTISHSFSKNWEDHAISGGSKERRAGICGHTFVPVWNSKADTSEKSGISWVNYTPSKSPRLDKFSNVRMFYGPATGTQLINVNGKNIRLEGKRAVNELYLNKDIPVERVKISFSSAAPLDVYGFSMDSENGVFVDNFALRGNSGLTLSAISPASLSGINDYLAYDLIILQFGVNVANSKVKDYSSYAKGMEKVVEFFKRNCPGSSILIVGTGDRGYQKDGKWTTDPGIPFLVAAQKTLAEKTRSGFWSLYDAMGGYESMAKRWANGDTLYANKDYTHFNHRGAKRVGQMLFYEIYREYKLFKASAQDEK
ncbi:MAG TPA: hypothetical protein VI731_07875 [Bacteroidia bacterium]|nr:hypothetical protein [Bacteroidia bacterium]